MKKINSPETGARVDEESFRKFLEGDNMSAVAVQKYLGGVVSDAWQGLSYDEAEEVVSQLTDIALSEGEKYLAGFDPSKGYKFETYFFSCMKNEVRAMQRRSRRDVVQSCGGDMNTAERRSSSNEPGADAAVMREESRIRIDTFIRQFEEWMETLKPLQRRALQIKLGLGLSAEDEKKIEEIKSRPYQRNDGVYSVLLQEEHGLTPENARQKLNEANKQLNVFINQYFHGRTVRTISEDLFGTGFRTKEKSESPAFGCLADISSFSDEQCAEILISMASRLHLTTQYATPELSQDSIYPLTDDQEILFAEIEGRRMPFDGFYNFAELRAVRGVGLKIIDREDFADVIDCEIGKNNFKIKSICRKLKRGLICPDGERELTMVNIVNSSFSDLKDRLEPDSPNLLLGLYSSRYYLSGSPCIYLFKDNIEYYSCSRSQDPDYVSAYVYVHELMHAYYDSINREGYHCIPELEEAFAEYGMLFFLHATSDTLPLQIWSAACGSVENKWQNGPKEYGFGIHLKEHFGLESPYWIDRYRKVSNWIRHNDAREYCSKVKTIGSNDDIAIFDTCRAVDGLLRKTWERPVSGNGPIPIRANDGSGRDMDQRSFLVRNAKAATLLVSRRIMADPSLDRMAYRMLRMADPDGRKIPVIADATGGHMICYESGTESIKIPVAEIWQKVAEPEIWMDEGLLIGGLKWYLKRGWVEKIESEGQCSIGWALAMLNAKYIYRVGMVGKVKGPKFITDVPFTGGDINADPNWNRAQFYISKEANGTSVIYTLLGDVFISERDVLDAIDYRLM